MQSSVRAQATAGLLCHGAVCLRVSASLRLPLVSSCCSHPSCSPLCWHFLFLPLYLIFPLGASFRLLNPRSRRYTLLSTEWLKYSPPFSLSLFLSAFCLPHVIPPLYALHIECVCVWRRYQSNDAFARGFALRAGSWLVVLVAAYCLCVGGPHVTSFTTSHTKWAWRLFPRFWSDQFVCCSASVLLYSILPYLCPLPRG